MQSSQVLILLIAVTVLTVFFGWKLLSDSGKINTSALGIANQKYLEYRRLWSKPCEKCNRQIILRQFDTTIEDSHQEYDAHESQWYYVTTVHYERMLERYCSWCNRSFEKIETNFLPAGTDQQQYKYLKFIASKPLIELRYEDKKLYSPHEEYWIVDLDDTNNLLFEKAFTEAKNDKEIVNHPSQDSKSTYAFIFSVGAVLMLVFFVWYLVL